MEAVAGVRVADDLGVHRRVADGLAQLLDLLDGDAFVLVAIAAEPGRLELRGELEQRGRAEAAHGDAAAVERDRGAERALDRLDERDRAAHAEPYDRDARILEPVLVEVVVG